jgi:Kef-type K+ transport system membrane component KefB
MVSLAIGIIFISTGDAVLFTVLQRTGEMKTRRGKLAIATTTADDIVGVLALSFFTFLFLYGSINFQELFTLFLIAIGFYVIMLTVGMKIINKIIGLAGYMADEQILFSIPIGIVFLLAVMSENIGLGIATGAFLAGMAMAKSRFKEEIIIPKLKIISDGFVIPVFYALIGTYLIFAGINIPIVILLTAAAILGKILGTMALGKLLGMRTEDTKVIGVLMTPRGDYNLAVSQIALALGVFSAYTGLYTSVVFSIILTILIAPILIKITIGKF